MSRDEFASIMDKITEAQTSRPTRAYRYRIIESSGWLQAGGRHL